MSGIVRDPPAAPGSRTRAGTRPSARTRGVAGIDPGRLPGTGRSLAAPLLLGVAALLLWQGAVWLLEIEPFIVPGPLAIAGAFLENLRNVLDAAAVTGANAAIGLVVGGLLGVAAAVASAAAPVLDRLAAPMVVALSVIPIVALAPVLYTMYGADQQATRQIVAGIAVFIPVYVNSLRGFRQAAPVHRDLMRSYAAGTWQITRSVTLPSAVPYMFTGLRIASSLAVVSALIAEYFGGPVGGLGKSVTSAASSSNYTLAWAYVVGAVLLGLLFYAVTAGLEKYFSRHTARA
ncbi:ABC transporter permease subunit [Arthrobacter sp. Sa2CUA1]|uniref:ABC transporter permease subunit n=1 Tax=Arthrobacter gallicola TaxID=2762225 RepID=A0ABR8UNX9_9MICC|nr:ABC transporter permease subunit [Arthrobacter gallicola]MBD7994259.1 ABC transporter permease subunit [Arthrobacter gallicola]